MKAYDEAKTGAVHRARQLRRASTDAEKRLWRALRSKLPQFKWRRQMPIGPYFADFACFEQGLIIELDGGQHSDAVDYDDARTRFIEGQGYRVLRFWNDDVLSSTNGVLECIARALSQRGKKGAAKLRESEAGNSTSPTHAFGAGPSLSQGRGKMEAFQ